MVHHHHGQNSGGFLYIPHPYVSHFSSTVLVKRSVSHFRRLNHVELIHKSVYYGATIQSTCKEWSILTEHQPSGSVEVASTPALTFLVFDCVALFDLDDQSLFKQGVNAHYFPTITHLKIEVLSHTF